MTGHFLKEISAFSPVLGGQHAPVYTVSRTDNIIATISKEVNEIKVYKIPPLTFQYDILQNNEMQSDTFNISLRTTFANAALLKNSFLLMQMFPSGTHEKGGYYRMPNTVAINIDNEEVYHFGKYPYNYNWDNPWDAGAAVYNVVLNNNLELIFSYPMSHYMYIYEDSQIKDSVYIPSRFLSKNIFPPPTPADTSRIEDLIKFYIEMPRYFNLKYDSTNDLYYRMVAHPIDFFDENDDVQAFSDKPWSVIILDNKFNILNEVYFPPKQYDINFVIEDDDGFWIRKHDSDYYHFFQPVKMKCTK